MEKHGDFRSLTVYQKAFKAAMGIFEISKTFPKEEKYSLTDQIRRSSRSVCVNIAEAYRKRIYPKHFVSKNTDADGECSETMVWLDFSLNCHYVGKEFHTHISEEYSEIGKMLNAMILNPDKWVPKEFIGKVEESDEDYL
jgi:four helix bundle protein